MTLANLSTRALWILLGSLTILTLIDFGITKAYLDIVGLEGEANPIMRWAAEAYGVNVIAWVKLTFVSIFAVCIYFAVGRARRLVSTGLVALNGLSVMVAVYGAHVYLSSLGVF